MYKSFTVKQEKIKKKPRSVRFGRGKIFKKKNLNYGVSLG